MTDRVLLQPAYVLHQRAYRDTSAILELFTPEHGRLGVIAKGVRCAKPRWRGLLQNFQPLLVSFNQRGELGLLTEAEAQGAALSIHPGLMANGFYLNEILLRLLHRHESQLELFGWYDKALRELAALRENESENLEGVLRRFERRLLAALGYGLVLDRDVQSGMAVEAEAEYVYLLEQGPVRIDGDEPEPVSSHHHLGQPTVKMGIRVSGQTLLALQGEQLTSTLQRREAKRLLRAALSQHLGPKPLQSRQLLRQRTAVSGSETIA